MSRIPRREFIAICSTPLVTAIAGCETLGGDEKGRTETDENGRTADVGTGTETRTETETETGTGTDETTSQREETATDRDDDHDATFETRLVDLSVDTGAVTTEDLTEPATATLSINNLATTETDVTVRFRILKPGAGETPDEWEPLEEWESTFTVPPHETTEETTTVSESVRIPAGACAETGRTLSFVAHCPDCTTDYQEARTPMAIPLPDLPEPRDAEFVERELPYAGVNTDGFVSAGGTVAYPAGKQDGTPVIVWGDAEIPLPGMRFEDPREEMPTVGGKPAPVVSDGDEKFVQWGHERQEGFAYVGEVIDAGGLPAYTVSPGEVDGEPVGPRVRHLHGSPTGDPSLDWVVSNLTEVDGSLVFRTKLPIENEDYPTGEWFVVHDGRLLRATHHVAGDDADARSGSVAEYLDPLPGAAGEWWTRDDGSIDDVGGLADVGGRLAYVAHREDPDGTDAEELDAVVVGGEPGPEFRDVPERVGVDELAPITPSDELEPNLRSVAGEATYAVRTADAATDVEGLDAVVHGGDVRTYRRVSPRSITDVGGDVAYRAELTDSDPIENPLVDIAGTGRPGVVVRGGERHGSAFDAVYSNVVGVDGELAFVGVTERSENGPPSPDSGFDAAAADVLARSGFECNADFLHIGRSVPPVAVNGTLAYSAQALAGGDAPSKPRRIVHGRARTRLYQTVTDWWVIGDKLVYVATPAGTDDDRPVLVAHRTGDGVVPAESEPYDRIFRESVVDVDGSVAFLAERDDTLYLVGDAYVGPPPQTTFEAVPHEPGTEKPWNGQPLDPESDPEPENDPAFESLDGRLMRVDDHATGYQGEALDSEVSWHTWNAWSKPLPLRNAAVQEPSRVYKLVRSYQGIDDREAVNVGFWHPYGFPPSAVRGKADHVLQGVADVTTDPTIDPTPEEPEPSGPPRNDTYGWVTKEGAEGRDQEFTLGNWVSGALDFRIDMGNMARKDQFGHLERPSYTMELNVDFRASPKLRGHCDEVEADGTTRIETAVTGLTEGFRRPVQGGDDDQSGDGDATDALPSEIDLFSLHVNGRTVGTWTATDLRVTRSEEPPYEDAKPVETLLSELEADLTGVEDCDAALRDVAETLDPYERVVFDIEPPESAVVPASEAYDEPVATQVEIPREHLHEYRTDENGEVLTDENGDPVEIKRASPDVGEVDLRLEVHDTLPGSAVRLHDAMIELAAPPVLVTHGWKSTWDPKLARKPRTGGQQTDDVLSPNHMHPLRKNVENSLRLDLGQYPWRWAHEDKRLGYWETERDPQGIDRRADPVADEPHAFHFLRYDRKQDLRESAEALKIQVDEVANAYGYDGTFWIAGHSMGTLAWRTYLKREAKMEDGAPRRVEKFGLDGGPLLGAPLAQRYLGSFSEFFNYEGDLLYWFQSHPTVEQYGAETGWYVPNSEAVPGDLQAIKIRFLPRVDQQESPEKQTALAFITWLNEGGLFGPTSEATVPGQSRTVRDPDIVVDDYESLTVRDHTGDPQLKVWSENPFLNPSLARRVEEQLKKEIQSIKSVSPPNPIPQNPTIDDIDAKSIRMPPDSYFAVWGDITDEFIPKKHAAAVDVISLTCPHDGTVEKPSATLHGRLPHRSVKAKHNDLPKHQRTGLYLARFFTDLRLTEGLPDYEASEWIDPGNGSCDEVDRYGSPADTG